MTKQAKLKHISKVMDMVSKDVEKDVADFEGKEFTGKNVAEWMGNLSAAVQAVANAVKGIVDEELLK